MSYNQAWKLLFEKLHIQKHLDETGEFSLSAKQINSLSGVQARNMTKWDSRDARPEILKDAKVTILSTSRTGYVLLKGDGYSNLPASEPSIYHSPKKLEPYTTLPWREELTKESLAIDIAAISSMLKTFTQEDSLALTIRGRGGSSKFNFNFQSLVKQHRVTVDRAQTEVDSGYEGDRVWLIEAKIDEPEDFLVRQLYYPWRLWKTLTPKEVVPLFLTYSNRSFGFFKYRFLDEDNYQSISLVEKRWFSFDAPQPIPSLEEFFQQTRAITPASDVFPQADKLTTVISSAELYFNEISSAAELAERRGFDERQGQYYTTALLWIGFIDRAQGKVRLTQRGAEFVRADRVERFKILFQAIAATPVFRECIRRNLEGKPMSAGEIAELILAKNFANKTTSGRRAQTVIAWINWLWREHANLSAPAH
jgi:hypothetical protein